jgi:hypothetical protein
MNDIRANIVQERLVVRNNQQRLFPALQVAKIRLKLFKVK